LNYLLQGCNLPKVTNEEANYLGKVCKILGEDYRFLKTFIESTREYINNVTPLEFSHLKRMQLSDNEKMVPGFIDIYDSIIELRWERTDELIKDFQDFNELSERLFTQAMEDTPHEVKRVIR
jgi:hypothetical protein